MSLELLYNLDMPKKEEVKKEYVPFCGSAKCVPPSIRKNGGYKSASAHNFKPVRKNFPKYQVFCPDCSSVLIWKSVPIN